MRIRIEIEYADRQFELIRTPADPVCQLSDTPQQRKELMEQALVPHLVELYHEARTLVENGRPLTGDDAYLGGEDTDHG